MVEKNAKEVAPQSMTQLTFEDEMRAQLAARVKHQQWHLDNRGLKDAQGYAEAYKGRVRVIIVRKGHEGQMPALLEE